MLCKNILTVLFIQVFSKLSPNVILPFGMCLCERQVALDWGTLEPIPICQCFVIHMNEGELNKNVLVTSSIPILPHTPCEDEQMHSHGSLYIRYEFIHGGVEILLTVSANEELMRM